MLQNLGICLASQEAQNMSDLFGSDPTALGATVLAAVATGLTFLIALLIFLWGTALFDIRYERRHNPSN